MVFQALGSVKEISLGVVRITGPYRSWSALKLVARWPLRAEIRKEVGMLQRPLDLGSCREGGSRGLKRTMVRTYSTS